MPHNPKALQAILQTAAPANLALGFRPMFGGVMGYVDGKPFASMSDVGLALKMTGADHAALLALRGARPLQYDAFAPPSKTYVTLPQTMLSDREALCHWIARSVAGLGAAKPRRFRLAA